MPEKGDGGVSAKNAEIRNTIYEIHKKAARFFYSKLNEPEGEKAVKTTERFYQAREKNTVLDTLHTIEIVYRIIL